MEENVVAIYGRFDTAHKVNVCESCLVDALSSLTRAEIAVETISPEVAPPCNNVSYFDKVRRNEVPYTTQRLVEAAQNCKGIARFRFVTLNPIWEQGRL